MPYLAIWVRHDPMKRRALPGSCATRLILSQSQRRRSRSDAGRRRKNRPAASFGLSGASSIIRARAVAMVSVGGDGGRGCASFYPSCAQSSQTPERVGDELGRHRSGAGTALVTRPFWLSRRCTSVRPETVETAVFPSRPRPLSHRLVRQTAESADAIHVITD
jgi:hypothetical protein